MATEKDPRPFIVVTAILDQAARPAAVTVSHGDAIERAAKATAGRSIAGLDIVRLSLASKAFAALRDHAPPDTETAAVYDVFPPASHLDASTRRVAGQFLAAEILWALEEQGHLKGVPLNVKIDVPNGWDRAPKAVHEKLMEAGALDLDDNAIESFKSIKAAWDAPT